MADLSRTRVMKASTSTPGGTRRFMLTRRAASPPLPLRLRLRPRLDVRRVRGAKTSVTTTTETTEDKDGTTLSLAAMTWGEVFPVAELWTQIFCEYYYGVDNKEKTYERRVSEFLYYFTMLYSSIACALDNQAFCAIAFCARDEGKEASGAIAGRYVGPQLGSYHKVLFGDYWDTLAAQQFQADGEDLKLLYLWNFGVQRESRKRGVGEKIMKRVESVEATGVDIKGIFLFVYKTNHAAIRLYEKLGYSVVESWKDPRWMKQAENNLTGVERKLLMIKVV